MVMALRFPPAFSRWPLLRMGRRLIQDWRRPSAKEEYDIGMSEHDEIREAYLQMAEKARYRPQAPSDGMGGILLSLKELNDQSILEKEADAYAQRFAEQERTRSFYIGVSNQLIADHAFVYTIE